MTQQANHFTLLNTETEAEAELRKEVAALRLDVSHLTAALTGLTVVLEERFGMDVVSSDEDWSARR